jgi:hypothetical protein
MKIFTTSLTSGTFTVSASDGASFISILPLDSSSCNVLGGIAFKNMASTNIPLSNNNAWAVTSSNPSFPLDGITITWISGTINIMVGL